MSEGNKDSFLLAFVKYLLPVIMIAVALVGAVLIWMTKTKPVETSVVRVLPKVAWVEVQPEAVELSVTTQGTVSARRSTQMIADVSGVVEWVSPALYAGGFFRKGDLLLRIEPTDYVAALASAKSLVAQMQLLYQQELASSAQAQQDWERLGQGQASDLVLRKPQLAKAQADVEFAQASLQQAQRNLAYTEVKAPYDGRVHEKYVDVGQSVAAKVSKIASVYSTDAAEIRVPLSLQETGYVELPELFSNADDGQHKPQASVRTAYAGSEYEWRGYLDRTEGVIDARSRLVYAVVRVDDPYERAEAAKRPPLKVGMFVKVRIQGRILDDAIQIPTAALRPNDRVYVLDGENRLQIRDVTVVKKGIENVIVTDGLFRGERVIVSSMNAVAVGMKLEPLSQTEAFSTEDQELFK